MSEDWTLEIVRTLDKMVPILERIAKALEGETSVSRPAEIQASSGTRDVPTTDSGPLPKVVQTQNFVDVRECKDYSEKSYKLIGYDNRETYIAKQHVIRTESIEGGGTRVIVGTKSAWVITKLEWK